MVLGSRCATVVYVSWGENGHPHIIETVCKKGFIRLAQLGQQGSAIDVTVRILYQPRRNSLHRTPTKNQHLMPRFLTPIPLVGQVPIIPSAERFVHVDGCHTRTISHNRLFDGVNLLLQIFPLGSVGTHVWGQVRLLSRHPVYFECNVGKPPFCDPFQKRMRARAFSLATISRIRVGPLLPRERKYSRPQLNACPNLYHLCGLNVHTV